jgi:pimeloyl-ACP methyl ester carboxylesterase
MARTVDAQTMQRLVDDALTAQREHWQGWYDNGRFAEFTERLARIAVPTLCIGGDKDALVPPSRLRRDVAQPIGGCILVTLRHAGHNLPVETPDEIAQAILRMSS